MENEGGRIVNLGKVGEVISACEALHAGDATADATEALAALRKALVEPLGLGPDVERVLLSPEGPLGYVPFEALFDVPVAMTPSGRTHVLLRDEEGERGEGVLALGDPDYAGTTEGAQAIYFRGRNLVALPATKAVAEQIGTTTLLGAEGDRGRAALGAGRAQAVAGGAPCPTSLLNRSRICISHKHPAP